MITKKELLPTYSKKLGGCLCGNISFETNSHPIRSSYCYCNSCTKHTGSPVMLGVLFKEENVKIKGKLTRYYSSEKGIRTFCKTCGSSVFFNFEGSGNIEILSGAFNDNQFINPEYHLYFKKKMACFDIKDKLLKYDFELT